MPDPTPTAPKCPFELPVRIREVPSTSSPHRFSLADNKGRCIAERLTKAEGEHVEGMLNAHATLLARCKALEEENARLHERLQRLEREKDARLARAALAANKEKT